jgi:ketosteroid isomerase-like protein
MQIRFHIPVVLALMASFPLGLSPTVSLADDASDRRAIESAAQQWTKAFNERDATALTAIVTEDVQLLDGGVSPIVGPAHARDAWLRAAAMSQGDIRSREQEIVISGDVAWRVGSIAYKSPGGGSLQGQSLEIWKRSGDGWKLHRQMSSHIMNQKVRAAPSEPVLDRPTN